MLARWSRAIRLPDTCCVSCAANALTLFSQPRAISTAFVWFPRGPATVTILKYRVTAFASSTQGSIPKRLRCQDTDIVDVLQQQEQDCTWRTHGSDSDLRRENITDWSDNGAVVLDNKPTDQAAWDAACEATAVECGEESAIMPSEHEDSQQFAAKNVEYDLKNLWQLLEHDTGLLGSPTLEWPATAGPAMSTYNLPPQSLFATYQRRLVASRRRLTWKKLGFQEVAIAILVLKLLDEAAVPRLPATDFSSLSPAIQALAGRADDPTSEDVRLGNRRRLEHTFTILARIPSDAGQKEVEIAKVSADGIPVPRYSEDAEGDFLIAVQRMNAEIKDLFSRYDERFGDAQAVAMMVAKLCDILLTSSVAPNLQTFNIMLLGFEQWRRPKLFEQVIYAIERCRVRPNEITCAARLGYYIGNDQPTRFSVFVARMRGFFKGIMLARPTVRIREDGAKRLIRINENKVIQKVHPSPIVFHAIIRGTLKFAGFDRTMEICEEMKEDDWGLDVAGICYLLNDCVKRADWQGGLAVWEELSRITTPIRPIDLEKAYVILLALCSVTNNTHAFNQVSIDIANRGFDHKLVMSKAARIAQLTGQRRQFAPAFTADNVLIMESAPHFEGRDGDNEVVVDHDDDDKADAWLTFGEEDHDVSDRSRFFDEGTSEPVEHPQPADKEMTEDELWKAWIEHELKLSSRK